MLPEFARFIFTTIDTLTTTETNFTTNHTHFIKTNTDPVTGPKCDPY